MGRQKDLQKELKKILKAKKKIKNETAIIKDKYSFVSNKIKILQINNDAISEGIINLLKPKLAFKDTCDTIQDTIFLSTAFIDIIGELTTSLGDSKYLKELKELDILTKDYCYVMIIDNPIEG